MPSTNVAAAPILGAMKTKTIFRNESQKLDAAFIEAGLPERVLLVPLDFAKITHYACFCDGRGTYLRKAFTVKNNQEGLDYLVDQIERTRKARSIKSKRHVIVGGDDGSQKGSFRILRDFTLLGPPSSSGQQKGSFRIFIYN